MNGGAIAAPGAGVSGVSEWDAALAREILAGLTATPKTLPAKLFYDAEGCRLFGAITELPEYYLTRTETALLRGLAPQLAEPAVPGSVLVEYGASDESKALFLLGTGRFSAYVPVDIAAGALDAIRARLARSHPALPVIPVVADFTRPVQLPALVPRGPRFGFFPGSTIGNFEPDAARVLLADMRRTLAGGSAPSRLLVGADLRKDPALLLPAYDDASGVTAAFNRNMLAHVNRVADGDFDPATFAHRARWNDRSSRVEMHLESRIAQEVRVAGRIIRFVLGETIHTENSYKHPVEALDRLAAEAGWMPAGSTADAGAMFAIHAYSDVDTGART